MPLLHLQSFRVGLLLLAALLTALPARAAEVLVAEPFEGVRYYRLTETAPEGSASDQAIQLPRPLVIHVLRIDPKAEGIRFLVQPGNGEDPGEVTRQTTRQFVRRQQAQIGINGDFYDTRPPYPPAEGRYFTDVRHIGVSEGEVYSLPTAAGQAIFHVSAEGEAQILTSVAADSAQTQEGVTLFNAIGGNQRLITAGRNTVPENNFSRTLHPRTAVAIDVSGHVLLLLVDGRQSGYSEGMSTGEMADLLIEHFDAWDGLNLDGGGSSTMVMEAAGDLRVVNSPSDGSTPQAPGRERLVANNLAVFAQPKAGYRPLPQPVRPPVEVAEPVTAN